MTMETLANPAPQTSDLGSLLQSWVETPPASVSTALTERGIDAESLENYARSGLSPEETENLRKVLVQGASSENPDDGALLSRMLPVLDPRERAWDRVLKAKNSGEILTATVTEATKGGLVADLGVRGFVPASQVGLSVPRNLQQFVGRELRLRVLEVDRRRQTVILSNRSVMEEERASKRRTALERLEEGQDRQGIVRRLTDIGAFVDVGGVDGLLHVSEISWKRVEHPSEVLKVGQKVQVKVLRVDADAGRVSLSMRRLTADPWEEARRKYAVGSVLQVKIGKLAAQGAEVELEEGLDGFIPISELAPRRIAAPEEVVHPGQEVTAVVIDFRPRERRIVFSLRKLEQKKERQDIDNYQKKVRRTSDRTTLGDLFGHLFEEYQREEQAHASPAAEEAAATAPGTVGDVGAAAPSGGSVAQEPEPQPETGLAQDAAGEVVPVEGEPGAVTAAFETAPPAQTAAIEEATADRSEETAPEEPETTVAPQAAAENHEAESPEEAEEQPA